MLELWGVDNWGTTEGEWKEKERKLHSCKHHCGVCRKNREGLNGEKICCNGMDYSMH